MDKDVKRKRFRMHGETKQNEKKEMYSNEGQ